MENITDVMLDLETFDSKPTGAIVKISAVPFNIKTGKIFDSDIFDVSISLDSCIKAGLTVSENTIYWWLNQNDEARKYLMNERKSNVSLTTALSNFLIWFSNIKNINSIDNLYIWGNGAAFDLAMLSNAFRTIGLNPPYKPSEEQDVRTVVRRDPSIKKNMLFEGIRHNPEHDCKHQIKYVCRTINQPMNFD